MPKLRLHHAAISLVVLGLLFCNPGQARKSMSPDWKTVDKLIADQKMQEAVDLVDKIRLGAQRSGDEEEQTRALVREVQLRVALHGYETSVRFLREQPWPKGALWRSALDLYYARSLVTYYQAYSWEINQREKVESKQAVDLKAWTKDQIFAEAQKAYADVWQRRADLGDKPLSALSDYLSANNYPANIRGTLRDAVSYLAVEMLADSSAWRPDQSNDLFRLDWKALLSGGHAPVKLDDPEAHPLVKLGAVLDDLESWHQEKGQEEAALEARLERLRRLRGAFSDERERTAIRKHLETLLPKHRHVEWWAMGQAQLAEMVREDGDLVRAHALAVEGRKAYPSSLGGNACLSIEKSIEAPDYELAAMMSDAPGQRSIAVTHKNLGALHFRAWSLDLLQRITTAKDYNVLYNYDELRKLVGSTRPMASWDVQLPATPDFQSHRTYVTPPPSVKNGWYVIAASVRDDFREAHNRVFAVNFIATDLVIVTRPDASGGEEARVVSGATGKPIAGAEVDLYRYDWQHHHTRVDSKRSDDNGLVSFAPSYDGGHSYFLLARKGDAIAVDLNYLYFSRPGTPSTTLASLVYTDRSIYRPLQKLQWKVVAYRGRADEGKYSVAANETLAISLFDPNNQEVAKQSVVTGKYGSAAGEFTIPTGRLLGQWTVRSTWSSGASGQALVRVEEYKRPTFEVTFKDSDEALRLNKPAVMKGEARYYFGLPVTAGTVKWRVTREPVYPWWWYFWGWGGGGGTQTVATGATPLGADGTFAVKFTPEVDEEKSKDVTYRYDVAADLTDEGGETRSAERSFRLGLVTVEASLSTATGFLRAGNPGEVTIRRTNLDGVARAGRGTWKLFALKQPSHAVVPSEMPIPEAPGATQKLQTPGDKLRPRWQGGVSPEQVIAAWADGDEKANGDLTHGADGNAKVTVPSLPAGAYRLRYETIDDFGAKYTTWKDLVVAAPRTPLTVPAALILESPTVKVGGTARFLVATGLSDQPLYFDLYRAGKLVERRRLGEGRDNVVEIPVGEQARGGFGVTLTAVRDHQLMTATAQVFVPWDNKELSVSFSTFRDKIRPGTKETWRVTVKGPTGDHVAEGAAEILTYMFDRSLDLFGPHSPPSVSSLYPSRTGVQWSRASLGAAQTQWVYSSNLVEVPPGPSLRGDQLMFYDSYGIGGLGRRTMMFRGSAPGAPPPAPAATAAPAEPEEKAPVAKREKAAEGRMGKPAALDSTTRSGDKDGDGIPDKADQAKGPALRSNFAETAFWIPQLLTDKDGSAVFEFTVPDSVTSWNVWVHAVTRDLEGGSTTVQTRSVKELMVRPYLPRFFREGDQADLKVVVNDAGDAPMSGTVTLDIVDPDTQESKLALFGVKEKALHFSVDKGKGTNVTFPVTAPRGVGIYAFKVVATSGALSDGELRPLPVLPSRVHLIQSRFVTLRDADKRTMTFADLKKNDDPSLITDQMVVSVDAQLFYTVLKALPYLVRYPYECTEQTLNRFVSTGIVSSLYKEFPAIAKMAAEFGKRQTQAASFDAADPNRKMALEETPWLQESRGGARPAEELIDVLDPKIARANRDEALAKLRKAQTSLGAFPWFPGGPPSPYMTLYIMHGFAKATEFGVDVPKDMVQRGWQYLAKYVRDEIPRWMKEDCCWEFLTFLNYVATAYPDASWTQDALSLDDRKKILDFSFKHWKHHSPYLKAYLALTLKRMGRLKDGLLVFQSVMDSAKTAPDQGTFWAAEDRSWLWYEDTIESHAFALRTLMELEPKNPKKDGLVLWLLLNKKLNQWKSTRATAEVIYSLIHYLKAEHALGVREEAKVTIGQRQQTFTFEPDQYVGRSQIVIPGAEVKPQESSTITVEKQTKGFMFASATWHFSTSSLPPEERGDFFHVSRKYYKRVNTGKEWTLQPLAEGATIEPGDQVEVQLSLRTKHAAEYVHLRDPRAAGLEPENAVSQWKWDLGIVWYEETRDSGANFFFEQLPVGEYTFKYRLRANLAGRFRVGPATVQSMYAPEFTAYSSGTMLNVAAAK
jgi:uncharacterized protein YfaS (alpha-2-macroglobulin family)